MQESQANRFYERIVQGQDYAKTIELEHGSGEKLENVKMKPVDKGTLASVIQTLPAELFEALEEADSAEEAEEQFEESTGSGVESISAMNKDTVKAFEDLCKESLSHEEYTSTQMDTVIEALGFEVLFALGGEIIDMSFSDGSAVKDFREQG